MKMSRPIRLAALGLLLLLFTAAVIWRQAGRARSIGALPAGETSLAGAQVRGELNDWGAWPMSDSLGGTLIHVTGPIASVSDSASEFKFFRGPDAWYGSGAALAFGQIAADFSASGGNSSFDHLPGSVYVFKWDGDRRGVLFRFGAAPATITRVSRTPARPAVDDSVAVTAEIDAPTGQALWLRYALGGNWEASTVVKMAGSLTSYTATIPPQAAGATVSYYVFTSGDVAAIAGADADLLAITYNTNGGENYSYTVAATSAAGPITVKDARALWLDAGTIAWGGAAGSSYRLLYDPDGGMTDEAEAAACAFPDPAGPCFVTLVADGTVGGYPKNPNATGMTRLTARLAAKDAKSLLRGQVVVAAYDAGGRRTDATRAQIQSVLDDLYAAAATPISLGVTYTEAAPAVMVWAPTAKSMTLRRYATSTGPEAASYPMNLHEASGTWAVEGDASWDRQFYLLDVEVYVPSLDKVVHNLVTDPYSVNLSADTVDTADPRSQFINLADADLKPAGWDKLIKPALAAPEDIVIYETHVRDFSINDSTVPAAHRGTFLAFTDTASDGMKHLIALQRAGLTHIHLLPAFDIASVPENNVPRTVSPNPTGYARDGKEEQAAVSATRGADGFNWGYDPYHYGAPEGSYATNPDGAQRVREFREMVEALSNNGLRVVMDMVYNHTAASGQNDKSVLDKVVPGYYYRYTADGALYTDSCCDDTASEYAMFEKLMVDTLTRWAVDYKVDGFRFDLMNFHTRQNMLDIKAALTAVDPSIYLYGEGWDFGSAVAKGLTACPDCYAKQANMTGTGIGSFNDKIRDAAHGGYSTDDLGIRKQGFINGLSYDWNGYEYDKRFESDLGAAMDVLRSGLRASGTDWNGQGQPFTDDPQESVPYVEKHDNETLFDQNVFKLPIGTSMADRVRAQNLGTSLIALAQGVPFFQEGQDILRSKSLDRNSYDSGDWFNRLDWSYNDGTYANNFGVGLPPAGDNRSRWDIMAPLLANAALNPSAADAQFSAAHLREMLRVRKSSPLFRLTTEAEVNARVSFYNTANHPAGLLVMSLSDTVGANLDPNYAQILVFFNANKIPASYAIPGANGFKLHPVQADAVDADPVVQSARFDDPTDTFTIPPRTTAVFVSAQATLPASTLDWVGRMSPAGGVAHEAPQGAAINDFQVAVQVYEKGVTEAAGEAIGIACYLHWGAYGSAWNDTAMAWSAQRGNNDEYRAALPLAVLNTLAPGTYGFTAYCRKPGEAAMWPDGDRGDGLLTVLPAADASPAPEGGVFVHLFEWRWADIEKECPYLAQRGYAAVQVSPPQEHIVPTADMGGGAANDFPWWVRYQPVSHDVTKLTSRSGTLAEFKRMVQACNAVGVGIYVDAVINHMAAMEVGTPPRGTADTPYDSSPGTRFYGTQYQADDFHPDCPIVNYGDRTQVQTCALSGLPDLNTGKPEVQAKIRGYLQALLDIGVKGFRIDGGKHMAAQDIGAILKGLNGKFYVFQETIDQSSGEPVRDWEYAPEGDVTEFSYTYALGDAFDDSCGGSLSDLETRFMQPDMLPSRFAQVFTDNHDNQRGQGVGSGCVVDHRDGQVHVLANIFALAYPYGYPSVMSSYYWQSNPDDDTGDALGPPSSSDGGATWGVGRSAETRPVFAAGQVAGDAPANCSATFELGKWACEHRRTAVANMVAFRRATAGEAVRDWQNIGGAPSDHIAFGLGQKGFVAINRTGSAATTTYATAMPDGVYCDVVHYDFNAATKQCVAPGTATPAPAEGLITVRGSRIVRTLAAMDAFAIYTGAGRGR